jgi:hypothetical protein
MKFRMKRAAIVFERAKCWALKQKRESLTMKSILTYPDFQALPKGLKRMLVTSENLFFAEAKGLTSSSPIRPAPRGLSRYKGRATKTECRWN